MRLERVPGLRQAPGRFARRRPDLALFDSWRGSYSDNPRAISEALRERRPDLAQVWVADEATAAALPDWAGAVRPGTCGYLAALGCASYVVTNIGMPGYYRKPRGTAYLQTWHGTPLKRIAFEIVGPPLAEDRRFRERLRRDVARWDALVSQNAFSTRVLRKAFRYEGRIVETGYPRNDVLSCSSAPARRRAVREQLGLAPDTKAVLYAPTWRDTNTFSLELDVVALARALGDGWSLLLRAHPLAQVELDDEQRGWVIDVSRHADVRDLYLAADVLVTDYSSAMFDFAVTGRPMLFFTYDLDHYRDALRGFYVDFEAEAPGPLLATTAAIADALRDLDAVADRYRGTYAAFVERYCPLDDGAAADRVIDVFFDG